MHAEYPNFAALAASHQEGEAFDRVVLPRERARIIMLAPHGGCIEPQTAEIATEIAGEEISLYCFRSKLRGADGNLHITSHNFNDPVCIALVSRHESAVAIHGCVGDQPEVFLGGLDAALGKELARALRLSEVVVHTAGHEFLGTNPRNICNRTASGAGVQLELTMPLRKGEQRAVFVAAVRSVLLGRSSAAYRKRQ